MKKIIYITILFSLSFFVGVGQVKALGDVEEPVKQNWSFSGPFGTYDKASLQRGYKVYREVCSACHSMKRIAFRNLVDLGYNEEDIKKLASSYIFEAGPNEEGEIYERAGLPSDYFKSPFANEQQARFSNGGAFPPDLSLITKAREGGANYVYSLLTGYEPPPADAEMLDGQHWNKYMPGNKIAMAPPLSDGLVEYSDGSPMTVSQYAKDVSQFLTWAAEPEMEHRKRMGIKVIIFLLIFAGIMYAVKRRIWSDIH